jgi:hypothetical protein
MGFAIANDVERRTTPAVLLYRSRRDAPGCTGGECWGFYLSSRNRAAGSQAVLTFGFEASGPISRLPRGHRGESIQEPSEWLASVRRDWIGASA